MGACTVMHILKAKKHRKSKEIKDCDRQRRLNGELLALFWEERCFLPFLFFKDKEDWSERQLLLGDNYPKCIISTSKALFVDYSWGRSSSKSSERLPEWKSAKLSPLLDTSWTRCSKKHQQQQKTYNKRPRVMTTHQTKEPITKERDKKIVSRRQKWWESDDNNKNYATNSVYPAICWLHFYNYLTGGKGEGRL